MEAKAQAQARDSMHPLMMIAGLAVILFCAAGIAAIMGWIPTSIGNPAEPAPASQLNKAQDKSAQANKGKEQAAHAKQAGAKQQLDSSKPAGKPKCSECGVVQSVREVEKAGEGTGLGAVGGAVVGGVVGHQMGGGRGNDVMTVVGAVGGGVAGHQIEKKARATKSYEVTVRFEDGSLRTMSNANPPAVRPGDKVKLVNGTLQANG